MYYKILIFIVFILIYLWNPFSFKEAFTDEERKQIANENKEKEEQEKAKIVKNKAQLEQEMEFRKNQKITGIASTGFSSNPVKAIGQLLERIKQFDSILDNLIEAIDSIYLQFQKIPSRFQNISNSFISTLSDLTGIKYFLENLGPIFTSINETISKIPSETTRISKIIFLDKIGGFFQVIGKIMENNIINPFKALFTGIGNIFVILFKVLLLIVDKLISLPGCIFYYSYLGISNFLKLLLPSWVTRFFQLIVKWIIGPILKFFYYIIIYPIRFLLMVFFKVNFSDDFFGIQRCTRFEIKPLINEMANTFSNIGTEFRQSFGKFPEYKL